MTPIEMVIHSGPITDRRYRCLMSCQPRCAHSSRCGDTEPDVLHGPPERPAGRRPPVVARWAAPSCWLLARHGGYRRAATGLGDRWAERDQHDAYPDRYPAASSQVLRRRPRRRPTTVQCGPSPPPVPGGSAPRRICSNCTRAAICWANSAVWMPWNRPSSQPTSCACAIRSSASDGVLSSVNGSDSRSSSSRSSGARPSSSSRIERWWISRSRLRLASSSGAARTSSSSCLIIVPIRITLAGCSTRLVTSSPRPSSHVALAVRNGRGTQRRPVRAHDHDVPLPGAVRCLGHDYSF